MRRSDRSTLQGTMSKIKETWKQTVNTVIPPILTKKITLSFQLSLVTILKMHFLFCLYRAYLITYWQALVGAHCSIYTCTISKICFYFLLFLLVCLFETVWTQSLN